MSFLGGQKGFDESLMGKGVSKNEGMQTLALKRHHHFVSNAFSLNKEGFVFLNIINYQRQLLAWTQSSCLCWSEVVALGQAFICWLQVHVWTCR